MSNLTIPVYVVKSKYHYDEHDADVLGTFFSKEEAERLLYKSIIELAIDTGDIIRKEPYNENWYNVASSYSYWIDQQYVEVK